jgi:Predicted metal binding domain
MQMIDPAISKAKFEEELRHFFQAEAAQRLRGILLLKAEFPDILIQFAAPQLQPPAILFTVKFNLDNYDLLPISVRFVHPFSFQNTNQVVHPMPRMVAGPIGMSVQNMIQQDPATPPFLCIPGTREYHSHPAHTGDDWLLHRRKGGEGTLGFLIEKIYEYGTQAVSGYQIAVQSVVQSKAIGISLDQNKIPL